MTRIDVAMTSLPFAPPFRLRARILTPLATGTTRYLADGAVDVDARGRISRVEAWPEAGAGEGEPAPGAGGRRLPFSGSCFGPRLDAGDPAARIDVDGAV